MFKTYIFEKSNLPPYKAFKLNSLGNPVSSASATSASSPSLTAALPGAFSTLSEIQKMNSKFIDSMLPKYGQGDAGGGNSAVNYSSAVAAAARMYPYVSMGQQSPFAAAAAAAAVAAGGLGSVGFGSPLGAGGDVNDKSVRFSTASSVADSMVNYTLANAAAGHNPAATAAGIAAAAQFYHQAAVAASGGDPLGNQCAQGAQGLPDLPRYPWMAIPGNIKYFLLFQPRITCKVKKSTPIVSHFIPYQFEAAVAVYFSLQKHFLFIYASISI